jgi:hypothetical protein
MRLGIRGELFSRRCQRKGLDEFIAIEKVIDLSRAPTRRDVFDRRADENDRVRLFVQALLRELVHESFDMKLPKPLF